MSVIVQSVGPAQAAKKGSAVASAATVVLTSGSTQHITGVTTITDIDFDTAADGAYAWVVFDGALVLTYNATTLKLPGSANITTQAGDTALFFQDSGDNVICLFYERQSAGIGAPKGAAVASAATVVLSALSFQHITGTTTITDVDFDAAQDGNWGWVVFDGALTLTHNATTLILPGGANITTAAGDRALFVQDSSDNVYCLAYITASGKPLVNTTKLAAIEALASASGYLKNDGSGNFSYANAGVDVQVFTGSGTWTKPSSGTMALIRAWGAGGSGGRSSSTGGASGGGGGGYSERWVPLSSLGATETVTVGAGGAAKATASVGAVGGNTTFGSWLTAYGGGGGGNSTSSGAPSAGGGGGGGAAAGSSPGTGGAGTVTNYDDGATSTSGSNTPGGSSTSIFGGAGGGNGAGNGSTGGSSTGGNSIVGGAGGGGTRGSGGAADGAGGTSTKGGGAGGAGSETGTATTGSAPGGGGGGSRTGTSGAGGAGRVEVYVF